jgi:hypothetical protein
MRQSVAEALRVWADEIERDSLGVTAPESA